MHPLDITLTGRRPERLTVIDSQQMTEIIATSLANGWRVLTLGSGVRITRAAQIMAAQADIEVRDQCDHFGIEVPKTSKPTEEQLDD